MKSPDTDFSCVPLLLIWMWCPRTFEALAHLGSLRGVCFPADGGLQKEGCLSAITDNDMKSPINGIRPPIDDDRVEKLNGGFQPRWWSWDWPAVQQKFPCVTFCPPRQGLLPAWFHSLHSVLSIPHLYGSYSLYIRCIPWAGRWGGCQHIDFMRDDHPVTLLSWLVLTSFGVGQADAIA